jgi:hypothetical protein
MPYRLCRDLASSRKLFTTLARQLVGTLPVLKRYIYKAVTQTDGSPPRPRGVERGFFIGRHIQGYQVSRNTMEDIMRSPELVLIIYRCASTYNHHKIYEAFRISEHMGYCGSI